MQVFLVERDLSGTSLSDLSAVKAAAIRQAEKMFDDGDRVRYMSVDICARRWAVSMPVRGQEHRHCHPAEPRCAAAIRPDFGGIGHFALTCPDRSRRAGQSAPSICRTDPKLIII